MLVWQRSTLDVSGKDKVANEEVTLTAIIEQQMIENICRERSQDKGHRDSCQYLLPFGQTGQK